MLIFNPYLAPEVNYVMYHLLNTDELPYAKSRSLLICALVKELRFHVIPNKLNQQ